MIKFIKYACPVCDNRTLNTIGDVCPVCGWKEEGFDEPFVLDGTSSANARLEWQRNGFINRYNGITLRKPFGIEKPDGFCMNKYDDDFEIAFCDEFEGKRAALRLAVKYGGDLATRILDEVEEVYCTNLRNITIENVSDKEIITMKLCADSKEDGLKRICDCLYRRFDLDKHQILNIDTKDGNKLIFERTIGANNRRELFRDIENCFIAFICSDILGDAKNIVSSYISKL